MGKLDPETALEAIRDIATEAVNEHETPMRRVEMIRRLCEAVLETSTCGLCGGRGWVHRPTATGAVSELRYPCPSCEGAGRVAR